MEKNAFLFALLAALSWGVAPAFGKLGLSQTQPWLALALRNFFVAAVMLGWALAGGWMAEVGRLFASRGGLYVMAEGLFGALLGQLAYFYAIKYGEASRVVPVASSFPLFALILGLLLLRERFDWDKVIGTVLIVLGIIFLRR